MGNFYLFRSQDRPRAHRARGWLELAIEKVYKFLDLVPLQHLVSSLCSGWSIVLYTCPFNSNSINVSRRICHFIHNFGCHKTRKSNLPTVTNYRTVTIKNGQWKFSAKFIIIPANILKDEISRGQLLQRLKLTLTQLSQAEYNNREIPQILEKKIHLNTMVET